MNKDQQHPAVVYNVLVDRFYQRGAPLRRVSEQKPPGLGTRHGGDLLGLCDKLEHIVSLGVDTLVLSPVWPAALVTGDQVEDFYCVCDSFGGEQAFAEFIERSNALKLRVLLTGIFDRLGKQHAWFVRASEQEVDDGRVDPSQRSRSFFCFEREPYGYSAYRGDPDRPELNLSDYALRHKLFHGDRSVLRAWLERGIAGWVIDQSESLGYEVLQEIHSAARSFSPNTLIIGDAHSYSAREMRDGIVDGVVNHHLREALLAFLRMRISSQELARILNRQLQAYGFRALARCFNVLSGPGQPRILDALDGDKDLLRLAVQIQFLLPGAAIIYFGDEIGAGGDDKCAARCPMPWDTRDWDQDILKNYQQLGQLRQEQSALINGDAVDLTPQSSPDVLALARIASRNEEIVVGAFNRAQQAQQVLLFIPVSGLADGLPMRDVLSGEKFALRNGVLDISIPPRSARILVTEPEALPGYRFMSRH